MSYLIKVATIDIILSLHRRGWSQRRIARELDINRETVARYLRHAESASNPASAPTGSDTSESASKPANAPTGSDALETGPNLPDQPPISAPVSVGHVDRRKSECEPLRDVIQSKCDLGLSAQRIYQDLTTEHNFTGSYYSVRRFVHRLEPTRELPFRRLECGPGDEAQVDFGTGAPIVGPDGKRRKTHVFRIVLSHSRKAYSEVVYRQTTDDFLRCIESAFRHFGGVPRCLVLDNLRAAVKKADWFEPELNPKVQSFAEHYGLVFWPTRPYTPRHKGKVEKGVDYVQDNALKGRRFTSLQEENRFLLDWELTVADTRIHGTTRRQVGKHFTDVERGALLPLPLEPFPSFHEGRRTVHRDGHVEVERAYYAVPPEYLAREVWPPGADFQRADATDRHAHQAGAGPVQHSTPIHRLGEDQHGRARRRVAPGQGDHPAGPSQRHLGRGDDPGPWRRRGAGAPGPLEPCRPPSRKGDRAGLRGRHQLRGLSPPDHSNAYQASGAKARSNVIYERTSHDSSNE
jgi:transposase